MLDRTRTGHPNSTNRSVTRARHFIAATAAAWTFVLMPAAPAQAVPAPVSSPAITAQAAPAPAEPTATASQQPVPGPQYDTQPPGVSAYLPTEALITILIIMAVFVLGLRCGPAIAAAAIKALTRIFQNTPPGP
ncbi:hypothetical protein [Streptomyces sp. NRRL S-118]|uniref:hypothetical protein n=1 Tax=Streptomyces sp. NRRL S-118 TaxID=1463881 RepID=UPI0004CBF3DA|nr:hypothetical protein [Streptomyces sp. NRRL S-118]